MLPRLSDNIPPRLRATPEIYAAYFKLVTFARDRSVIACSQEGFVLPRGRLQFADLQMLMACSDDGGAGTVNRRRVQWPGHELQHALLTPGQCRK